jgi:hypothetical protein
MISLGLSAASQQTLFTTLASHHFINVKVQILDLSHNYLGDISSRFVDGQVDFDTEALVTRSLKLVLLDPSHQLFLDATSPDEGALFLDRQIRIIYNVRNPTGTFSVDIPLFCGPIRKLDRAGVLLNVECQGKEVLFTTGLWRSRTYAKGLRKTSFIYSVLYDNGERKLQIPVWNQPLLPTNVSIGQGNTVWGLARTYAASVNTFLFYDGRGTAVMRAWPQRSVYTFTEDVLKSRPQIGYDLDSVINVVQVTGAVPKGSKKPITYAAYPPVNHPLSPSKLQRNGTATYIPKFIKDDSIRTIAQAKALATRELNAGMIQAVTVGFDVLPGIGALFEPGDILRLATDEYNTAFRLNKMSVPLTAKGSSAIGYHKNLVPQYGPIRLRRR